MANKTPNTNVNNSRTRQAAPLAPVPQPTAQLPPTSTRPMRAAAQANHYINNLHMAEDEDENDADFNPHAAPAGADEEGDAQQPASAPTHSGSGRERRSSEKQLQIEAAAQEAIAEREAMADRAARREQEVRQPIDDNFIAHRTVASKPKAIKDLAQRNNRIPLGEAIPGACISDKNAEPSAADMRRQSHGNEAASPSFPHHNNLPPPSRVAPRTQNGHDDYPRPVRPLPNHQTNISDRSINTALGFDRDLNVQYTDRRRTTTDQRGVQEHDLGQGRDEYSAQLDVRYRERGDPTPLRLDARFPDHGGRRLSGSPVQHEEQPPQQEQQQHAFRGMEPAPSSAENRAISPYTGRPIEGFTLRLGSNNTNEHQKAAYLHERQYGEYVVESDDHLRKRTHNDAFESNNDDTELEGDLRGVSEPASHLTASGKKAKLGLKDCGADEQEYVKHIITGLRVTGSIIDIFPDQATMIKWVLQLRDKAVQELGGLFSITQQQVKMCTGRIGHLRGEAKTKIAPIVATQLFESGQHPTTIKANATSARENKDGNGFIYKDLKTRKGMYCGPLIGKGINVLYFANRRDEGPTFPEFFRPIPIPTIAFILTVIENCIDEWLTGTRTPIPFTANDYRDIYQGHVLSLQRFERLTSQYGILDDIRTQLYDNGRFHAGAQPLATTVVSHIEDDDIYAAIREYQDDRGEGPSGSGSQ
uniref:DUF6532 domain-containing protein n=1 Tax=Mycena chlorophos TaxID=658473 RepID=A0ABQ0LMF9_MYCCL|nr:predicted protein [Mycena chlorophos]